MRKIEKGHSYLLTQAMRAASRGVSRSKIAQRISSGRTRRSPRASVLRSLWLCCVWASIIKCQFQFLLSSAAALNWIYSFIILFVPTLRSTAFLCFFFTFSWSASDPCSLFLRHLNSPEAISSSRRLLPQHVIY